MELSKFIPDLTLFTEFLTSRDLVRLGLYKSENCAYEARRNGSSPHFIKVGRRVLYPKKSLVQFLEQGLRRGNASRFKALVGE